MKVKILLILVLSVTTLTAFAQDGGVRGRVVSRAGRVALDGVKVTMTPGDVTVMSDERGNFLIENVPAGEYSLQFETPEFEPLSIAVRVGSQVRDINAVVLVPDVPRQMIDDAVFAEFDMETVDDAQALPTSLSASKDIFNNIASYKFSEMRFNVRGYDSQYQDVYMNGIRLNDALTGYTPWSLWSGLNDATRNQEVTSGIVASDVGLGGIGGMTNIITSPSQMRKGLRASLVNGNSMYRFRAMVTYASGYQDNGWSYAFSVSTRQGGNSYVDGVYYNAFGYFAAVEKQFGQRHRLALTLLGAPTERGAQQAATQEAYDLVGNNYYNPNWGWQDGKKRNARVRNNHEPIVMLNYTFDISDRSKLELATALRFGKNGYSALTWQNGPDPRPDYYRYLPSYFALDKNYVGAAWQQVYWQANYRDIRHFDWEQMYQTNYNQNDPLDEQIYGPGRRSNYMVEERHTDQRDFNFAANIAHTFRNQSVLRGGLTARINRTEYYDQVKDLLGADYWLDVDKFALRDNGNYNPLLSQNDLDYYLKHGEARRVGEGDKFSYDYYANLRQAQVWAQYYASFGGFTMSLGGEVGYTAMWRDGRLRKGLFANNSLGKSKTLDYLTYKLKGEFSYRFSGAHAIDANVAYMVNPPQFRDAFVSARTRNTTTPGLDSEKVLGVDLSYNLNLPWITARVSGYYTSVADQSKVISYYDDTQSSFTNFAMSGIDKRYYGLEVGVVVPIWGGISFNGALSLGDYRYTSDANFTQTRDNSEEVLRGDKVLWDDLYVESTPQTALNLGLSYRGPRNWFASVDFNYYDRIYLSMNPARRTRAAYATVLRPDEAAQLPGAVKYTALMNLRDQEKFDSAYTLNLSVGKNWYIHRIYQLGFSLEVKNILNDQTIRTGGYEQMRLSRRTYVNKEGAAAQPIQYYVPFDSKYFYLLGTTYYLNVYFRF